jgi:leucyl aminopeptidase
LARSRVTGAGASVGRTLPGVVVEAASVAATGLLLEPEVDALAVPVAPAVRGEGELQPRAGTADAAARYGIALAELAERAGLTGAPGEAYTFHLPHPVRHQEAGAEFPWHGLSPRVVLVGVGAGHPDDLRRSGAALARATRGLRRVVTSVVSDAGPQTPAAVRAFVEGYLLAAYRMPSRVTEPLPAEGDPQRPADQLVLLAPDEARVVEAVADAAASAGATWLVRDLANTPSNTKDPAWMAEQAVLLAERSGLVVHVRGPKELADEGFGGILAVGAGSASTPRLVTVEYTPTGAEPPGGWRHVVVVGKGITYDTGGLSIKNREAMVPMKTDMAGAAVALATVLGAAAAGLPRRVTAVLPLAENHFGGASYRPGDVLRIFGGRTVEIANTDAEGRIVLADALAWADAELDPDILIDVATLTGAASIGLGRQHAALYSDDAELVAAFEAASAESGELVWHMPLVEEYRPAVRSDVADLRQVASDPRAGAGSITAALFLREFAGSRRWVHLDIAGPARASADKHEITEGATGFGARLLLRYLAASR